LATASAPLLVAQAGQRSTPVTVKPSTANVSFLVRVGSGMARPSDRSNTRRTCCCAEFLKVAGIADRAASRNRQARRSVPVFRKERDYMPNVIWPVFWTLVAVFAVRGVYGGIIGLIARIADG